MQADERLVIRIEHRAFCGDAIDWIRPVKHDHCNTTSFAGAHAKVHRPNESVISRADILQIDEQDVEPMEHLGSRLTMFTVQAVDRHKETRMLVRFPFHHVIFRLPQETVLWTKKRCELKQIVVMFLQDSRGVFQGRRNRGWMKQRADTRAPEFVWPEFAQMIEWQNDRHALQLRAKTCSGVCVKRRTQNRRLAQAP